MFRRDLTTASVLLVFLSGCATAPADRGWKDVARFAELRGAPRLTSPEDWDAAGREAAEAVRGKTIALDDEIRLALIRNPRLRAEYALLGFGAADVVEAGRLSNPVLSASVLAPSRSGESSQVGFGIAQSFTDLLLLPHRSRIATAEFEATKAEVGAVVFGLVRDVEQAHYRLIGAQQVVAMRETVATAARAAAELAQRFFDAGNITDLTLSVERAAAAQASVDAVAVRAAVVDARAALNVLMGLPLSEASWRVYDRLQLPVAEEDDLDSLQTLAATSRLELVAARQRVLVAEQTLSFTRTYRWLGSSEVGVETEREPDRSRITGPTASIEIPVFHQNQARVLRAQATLDVARADLSALEIETSNRVGAAHAAVANSRELIELHKTALVPLRERVVQRTQERVNYMLLGVFDLVRAKQEEYDAYQSYLDAVRDYWLARTELALAVGAPLPSAAAQSREIVEPRLPLAPPASGGHMQHGSGGAMPMPMQDETTAPHQMQHESPASDAPVGDNGSKANGAQHHHSKRGICDENREKHDVRSGVHIVELRVGARSKPTCRQRGTTPGLFEDGRHEEHGHGRPGDARDARKVHGTDAARGRGFECRPGARCAPSRSSACCRCRFFRSTRRTSVMPTRRDVVSALGVGSLAGLSGELARASDSSHAGHAAASAEPMTTPGNYAPVRTPNGWTLPFKMRGGVKEYHLVAEEVEHEFAPGCVAKCWGYNGTTPGPTIEAVEGDRVRLLVTNRLPEHTSVHWHGVLLPSSMDGVGGLSQPHIKPGETYAYEFTLRQHGTQMYHPHADEMVQMALGMMGMFVIHPKGGEPRAIDRDYCILLHNWALHPGTYRPDPAIMQEFDLWTFNSKVFPAIEPLVASTGDRVRIRIGNLSMWNHPIHLHGHHFYLTGSDGGRWPASIWRKDTTQIVGVGQTRDIEFDAIPGDWALHCHMSHHVMNAMGHAIPNPIGVDQSGVERGVRSILPGYVAMGKGGMAEHGEHLAMGMLTGPENTLPMMVGEGPFGPLEMGGMFTVVKVRDGLAAGDFADPGWYRNEPLELARVVSTDPSFGAPYRRSIRPTRTATDSSPGGHHE